MRGAVPRVAVCRPSVARHDARTRPVLLLPRGDSCAAPDVALDALGEERLERPALFVGQAVSLLVTVRPLGVYPDGARPLGMIATICNGEMMAAFQPVTD
jgi:hypothetical protein